MEVLSRFMAITVLGMVLCVSAFPAAAQDAAPMALHENKIKAGLLYNFLKYTQWPESARLREKQHLQVCLLGGDAFEGDLTPLDGRTAQQYVVKISEIEGTANITECNLVYINSNLESELPRLLAAMNGKPILTVSDIDGFVGRGGMVAFAKRDDRRIHLHINQDAIRAAQIQIQDRLLRLTEKGD